MTRLPARDVIVPGRTGTSAVAGLAAYEEAA